jgi:23S rRNA pseudouridine2605 synthase
MPERLSKFIARTGIASRRKAEQIIASGRVRVNGTPVTNPSHQVISGHDAVTFDGADINPPRRLVYIALHKPVGYLSDLADPRGRRLARELIDLDIPLFPVGRLDYNSDGLMLFTNDGAFANLVMHPRYETEKEYLVKLSGKLTPEDQRQIVTGLRIQGDIYRIKSVSLFREAHTNAWYKVIATTGKNRMVRKIAEALRHPVLKLTRVRIGTVTLAGLQPGEYKHFDPRWFLLNSRESNPEQPHHEQKEGLQE